MLVAEEWGIVYKSAIAKDGKLLFPQRLDSEFLRKAKRDMGSQFFANQYLNVTFPSEDAPFKREWFRYYEKLPVKDKFTFAYIDPAISTEDNSDFTGLVVLDVDASGRRYVRVAQRYKINPTKIIDLIFRVHKQFEPMLIGVESVAFQKAIHYFAAEEMRRRNVFPRLCEVKPETTKTKETKILGLVPLIEFGNYYFGEGLDDLETELLEFPKSKHDDLIDSLASIERIITIPSAKKGEEHGTTHDPETDQHYIRRLLARHSRGQRGEE